MPRIFLALVLFCLSGLVQAAEPDALRQQIDVTLQNIAELQKLQQQLRQEQDKLQQQLQATEVDIGQLEKRATQLQQEIKKTEGTLKQLHDKKGALERRHLEQQHWVAMQARVTYQNGHQEYLKLLLNQQSPETFSRTLTYYQYLSRARFTQIDALNQTLSELAALESGIVSQQAQLQERRARLDEQRTELAKLHETRRTTLASLNQQYSSRARKIKALQQTRARLEQTLAQVEALLARQAAEALAQQAAAEAVPDSFQASRGHLPWPVEGTLAARYGDAKALDGVLIRATSGTMVNAVYAGRVVFADWLQGAGLLVILDHGNGYLSLYGYNQSLLRNAGDLVSAGDPIATVGNSGGQENAALYFAIRQHGRPSDPAQWCRAQG